MMKWIQAVVLISALLLASSALAHAEQAQAEVDPNVRALLEEGQKQHASEHMTSSEEEAAFEQMENQVDASESTESGLDNDEDLEDEMSEADSDAQEEEVDEAEEMSESFLEAEADPLAAATATAEIPAAATAAAPVAAVAAAGAAAAAPAAAAAGATATTAASPAATAAAAGAATPAATPTVAGAAGLPPSPTAAGLALPQGANPSDKVCGCWNGGKCETPANKCICSVDWEGTFCERASAAISGRQKELERVAELTKVVADVASKIKEIEASTGSPEAIQKLVKQAADKELDEQTVYEATKLFYRSLAQNDVYTARRQLGLIKHIAPSKYEKMREELVANEIRLHKEIQSEIPKPQYMKEAIMHPELYQDVDVTTAKNTSIKLFTKAGVVIEDAHIQARQFNLDFGDNV